MLAFRCRQITVLKQALKEAVDLWSESSVASLDVRELVNATWSKVWMPITTATAKLHADIATNGDQFNFPGALPANSISKSQVSESPVIQHMRLVTLHLHRQIQKLHSFLGVANNKTLKVRAWPLDAVNHPHRH